MSKSEKYDELTSFITAFADILESVEFSGLEGDKKVVYGKVSTMSVIMDKINELEQKQI